MNRPNANKDAATYLKARMRIEPGENPCWTWAGSLDRYGYGKAHYRNKSWIASRLAYVTWIGPITSDEDVHHICRNARCINPAHLERRTVEHHIAEHYPKQAWRIELARRFGFISAESEL